MRASSITGRSRLSFRAVNRRGDADHDPGLQRHHVLPRQLLSQRSFGALFDTIGRDRIGFDDFRSNGLLLPATEAAALRIGLPMHRGPHGTYNAMVIERVGQIEGGWSALRLKAPEVALQDALMRLELLQRALRRRLLDGGRRPLTLNRLDPAGRQVDFTELDAMAEALWNGTEKALAPLFADWGRGGADEDGVEAETLSRL
jgi:A nuclease family of the HNH/ENDO VII superfamily with conserved AHH